MSRSPLITHVRLSPHHTKMENKKINKITIHQMAGNLTVESCGAWFSDPSAKSSSNYGIDNKGNVGLYVEEHNRAWTSYSSSNDGQAVTIEVANDGGKPNWHVSDVALNKLVDLCVDICQRNGIKQLNYTGNKNGNLTRHDMFIATTCPGPYLGSKFPWIAEQVNKRLNGQPASTTPSAEPTEPTLRRGSSGAAVETLQTKLNFIGYDCGIVDGIFGADTERALKSLQDNAGTTVDGVCGPVTWKIVNAVYKFAKSYTLKDFIVDVQKATGSTPDGIAGVQTIGNTITVSRKVNNRHAVVKAIQKRLYALGYITVGEADGDAGSKFEKAVKNLQKDIGGVSDGEITAGCKTWKYLLGMV